MEAFKKKYESFKKLLDANNDTLELMARLESVADGDFIFDMQFIRSRSTSILNKVGVIVEELNILGDNRYEAINGIYEGLQAKISHEIAADIPADIVPLVLPLAQVDRRFLQQVGGKNANLGEIKNRLGLPTPDGFVVTNEAYRLVMAENLLTDRIQKFLQSLIPDNIEILAAQSEEIKAAIRRAEIPAALQEEVVWHYQKLADTLGYQPALALRSSGIFEDQEFSFAGQFLTRLNVPFAEFFPAYLEVLASQFNRRALVYLCQKKLAHREQAMSVGCLAMVRAAASGVLFTVDPMNRQKDIMLLDASWGLGPAVVDGTVTPDEFVLHKRPEVHIVEQRLSDKQVSLEGQNNSGLTTVSVAPEKRTQPALTNEQILALGRYGVQLEDYFGDPQDIEFAIDSQGKDTPHAGSSFDSAGASRGGNTSGTFEKSAGSPHRSWHRRLLWCGYRTCFYYPKRRRLNKLSGRFHIGGPAYKCSLWDGVA